MLYRIMSITDIHGNVIDTEPHRYMKGKVGYIFPGVFIQGNSFIFQYQDKAQEHFVKSSPVQEVVTEVESKPNVVKVHTMNSIYTLERI